MSSYTIPNRHLELDFIRGIAIFLALGWHFNNIDTNFEFVNIILWPGRAFGWAGVDLFFVLSGFLIGGLLFKEININGCVNAKIFLMRRALKIWPVLYVFIIFQLVVGHYPWSDFLFPTLFHVQNYFLTPFPHLWSLAVEEHFYIAFAIFLSFFANDRANIKKFLFAIIFVSPLFRLIAAFSGCDKHALSVYTNFRLDGLAVGVLLSYIYVFEKEKFLFLTECKRTMSVLLLFVIVFLSFTPKYSVFMQTIGYGFLALGSAAFLLLMWGQATFLKNIKLFQVFVWLGQYSYAIYVFQFVFYKRSIVWGSAMVGDYSDLITLSIRYAGAIFVGVLVTKVIERPILKLRDKILKPTL